MFPRFILLALILSMAPDPVFALRPAGLEESPLVRAEMLKAMGNGPALAASGTEEGNNPADLPRLEVRPMKKWEVLSRAAKQKELFEIQAAHPRPEGGWTREVFVQHQAAKGKGTVLAIDEETGRLAGFLCYQKLFGGAVSSTNSPDLIEVLNIGIRPGTGASEVGRRLVRWFRETYPREIPIILIVHEDDQWLQIFLREIGGSRSAPLRSKEFNYSDGRDRVWFSLGDSPVLGPARPLQRELKDVEDLDGLVLDLHDRPESYPGSPRGAALAVLQVLEEVALGKRPFHQWAEANFILEDFQDFWGPAQPLLDFLQKTIAVPQDSGRPAKLAALIRRFRELHGGFYPSQWFALAHPESSAAGAEEETWADLSWFWDLEPWQRARLIHGAGAPEEFGFRVDSWSPDIPSERKQARPGLVSLIEIWRHFQVADPSAVKAHMERGDFSRHLLEVEFSEASAPWAWRFRESLASIRARRRLVADNAGFLFSYLEILSRLDDGRPYLIPSRFETAAKALVGAARSRRYEMPAVLLSFFFDLRRGAYDLPDPRWRRIRFNQIETTVDTLIQMFPMLDEQETVRFADYLLRSMAENESWSRSLEKVPLRATLNPGRSFGFSAKVVRRWLAERLISERDAFFILAAVRSGSLKFLDGLETPGASSLAHRLFFLPPQGGKIPFIQGDGTILSFGFGQGAFPPFWDAADQAVYVGELKKQKRLGEAYVHQLTVQGRLPDEFKYVAVALILSSPYRHDWSKPFFRTAWGGVAPMIHDGGAGQFGFNPFWKEVKGRTDYIQRVTVVYEPEIEALKQLPEAELRLRLASDRELKARYELELMEEERLLREGRAYQRLALALHAKLGTAPVAIPEPLRRKLAGRWETFKQEMEALLSPRGLMGAVQETWFLVNPRSVPGWPGDRHEAPWPPIRSKLFEINRFLERDIPSANRLREAVTVLLETASDDIDTEIGLADILSKSGLEELSPPEDSLNAAQEWMRFRHALKAAVVGPGRERARELLLSRYGEYSAGLGGVIVRLPRSKDHSIRLSLFHIPPAKSDRSVAISFDRRYGGELVRLIPAVDEQGRLMIKSFLANGSHAFRPSVWNDENRGFLKTGDRQLALLADIPRIPKPLYFPEINPAAYYSFEEAGLVTLVPDQWLNRLDEDGFLYSDAEGKIPGSLLILLRNTYWSLDREEYPIMTLGLLLNIDRRDAFRLVHAKKFPVIRRRGESQRLRRDYVAELVLEDRLRNWIRQEMGGFISSNKAADWLGVPARVARSYRGKPAFVEGIPLWVTLNRMTYFTRKGLEAWKRSEQAAILRPAAGEVVLLEAVRARYEKDSQQWGRQYVNSYRALRELGLPYRELEHPALPAWTVLLVPRNVLRQVFAEIEHPTRWEPDQIVPERAYTVSSLGPIAVSVVGMKLGSFRHAVSRGEMESFRKLGPSWVTGKEFLRWLAQKAAGLEQPPAGSLVKPSAGAEEGGWDFPELSLPGEVSDRFEQGFRVESEVGQSV